MTHPSSKIESYIEHRVAGSDPLMAARMAGYADGPSLKVVASRNEKRADVSTALRKAKRAGGVGMKSTPTKRQYRSVADEPNEDDLGKKLDPWKLKDKYTDPLALLLDVMNNPEAPGGLRIQCAKDAMPYCHARKEPSKTDDKRKRAKETTADSAFKPMPVPLRKVA